MALDHSAVLVTSADDAPGLSPTESGSRRPAIRLRGLRGRAGVAPAAIGALALVLRLLTAASGPTDWDSAQYLLAAGHYDVTHGLPQPPGYWLYVESGRALAHLGALGTVHALVLLAALASGLAAGLTVVAGRDLGGPWVGVAAGLVVATSPFAWFSGSVVATYSFDLLACPLLMILAWRARPGTWHGIAAVVAVGLLAGFRQSIVQSFALLALVSVVASTRTWRLLFATVGAAVASVCIWFVPMVATQPGGFAAWAHATRIEATGAAQSTSVLDHAPGGATNLGTFAGYTTVALAPLMLAAILAVLVLAGRSLLAGRRSGPSDAPAASSAGGADATYRRPWYQSRTAVLCAALVPAVLLVALVQFAKGGYLLAYLPAAVILLLLPLGALTGTLPPTGHTRSGSRSRRLSFPWLAVATVGVLVVVALGAQRFLGGDGVLPESWVRSSGSLWLVQPRYQAPYADTRSTIRSADEMDAALATLAPSVRGSRDVIVFDTVDGGASIYRNAGWALPAFRIALVAPGVVQYNQLHGTLYYASGSSVAVAPGGSVFLVASPGLPGLASLAAAGDARPVTTPRPIGYYRVFEIPAGASLLGVRVVSTPGPRPLGTGIA
jgi:hypothetical protein